MRESRREEVIGCLLSSLIPHPSSLFYDRAPSSASCSSNSGEASRTPRHLGYLLQPRNQPFRPWRSFIGEPHSGHTSVTATGGAGFFAGAGGSFSVARSSSVIGLVLRQFG